MSGHFHVHGPHDHEVEHAAEAEVAGHAAPATHGDAHAVGLAQRVALMTAILAFCGAISSWQGSNSLSEAMLLKNESILLKNQSVLKKTEASNQWNYYQAKSSKQNLAELALALAPKDKEDFYTKEIERYKSEKEPIRKDAEALEAEVKKYDAQSDVANKKSEEKIHPHHRWELAMTVFQIAISLASITILTRKRWLFITSGLAGAAGLGLAAAA
ncbi:MAG: DUF4337 domain-containing protein, partial [Betaproteobacteria bacterium]